MDEILRFLGIQKINEHGEKYYKAIVVNGYFKRPYNHRTLKRKCRTNTEAVGYVRRVIARWQRSQQVTKPRSKKRRQFS